MKNPWFLMRSLKMYFLAGFMAFLALPAMAQRLLTVEEAIATALKNNYAISLLRNDSLVYAINYNYRNYDLYPSLNANSTILFNRNNQKQKLADGTVKQSGGLASNNLQNSVNLNWLLFDGLKMFITRDKYAEFLKLSDATIKNQVVTLTGEVIRTYYNIVRQKQQLQAINEQMALNEERLALAEKKLGVGLGAKPEVLQSRLDLNAQRVARLTELSLIDQLKIELNRLMSIEDTTYYDVTDTIVFRNELKLAEIYGNSERENTELAMIRQSKRLAEFTLREAKADFWPKLSFVTAFNLNKSNNQAVINSFTPLQNRNYGFNYGLGLQLPIFNGFQVKRNIEAAKLDIQYQDIRYDQARNELNASINTAFKQYLLAMEVLSLEEENIKTAKENVFISKERLRLGITTVLELRETQKSLEDAYNRLIAARYNAKVAETDLLERSGMILK